MPEVTNELIAAVAAMATRDAAFKCEVRKRLAILTAQHAETERSLRYFDQTMTRLKRRTMKGKKANS